MKIPLILIAGYLGAGKTTLLKHILDSTDKKIAVLMNEFGDVGIDTQTVQKENIAVKELLEGCVCCSLQGEFEAGVKEIIKNYNPDIIIVETTGIAEADNLVVDIEKDLTSVILEAVITVVDADIMVRFPQISGSVAVQIKAADLIVLNKIDLVSVKDKEKILEKLKEHNSKARIIESKYCRVDLNILLSVEADHTHVVKSDTKHKFETFSLEVKAVDKKKFEEFLDDMPQEVFRVKGYVQIKGESFLINFVGGRWSLEAGEGDFKLVFIGVGINKLKEKIRDSLQSCAV